MTFPLFFRRIHLIESTGISLETLFNQNSNFCFYSFHNPKQKSETHPDNRVLARGKSCLEKCHEFKNQNYCVNRGDCSVCLFGGWMLIIQKWGRCQFPIDNPQVNTTVSKQ